MLASHSEPGPQFGQSKAQASPPTPLSHLHPVLEVSQLPRAEHTPNAAGSAGTSGPLAVPPQYVVQFSLNQPVAQTRGAADGVVDGVGVPVGVEDGVGDAVGVTEGDWLGLGDGVASADCEGCGVGLTGVAVGEGVTLGDAGGTREDEADGDGTNELDADGSTRGLKGSPPPPLSGASLGAGDALGEGEIPGGPMLPGITSSADSGENGPGPPGPSARTRNLKRPPGSCCGRLSSCCRNGYGAGDVLMRAQALAWASDTGVMGSLAAVSSAAAV